MYLTPISKSARTPIGLVSQALASVESGETRPADALGRLLAQGIALRPHGPKELDIEYSTGSNLTTSVRWSRTSAEPRLTYWNLNYSYDADAGGHVQEELLRQHRVGDRIGGTRKAALRTFERAAAIDWPKARLLRQRLGTQTRFARKVSRLRYDLRRLTESVRDESAWTEAQWARNQLENLWRAVHGHGSVIITVDAGGTRAGQARRVQMEITTELECGQTTEESRGRLRLPGNPPLEWASWRRPAENDGKKASVVLTPGLEVATAYGARCPPAPGEKPLQSWETLLGATARIATWTTAVIDDANGPRREYGDWTDWPDEATGRQGESG